MIRLVSVVSLPLLSEGIAAAVSDKDDIELVASSTEPAAARDLVREHGCTVALVDTRSRESNHVEIVADIRRIAPSTRVLLLGWPGREDFAVRLIRSGASGYISCSCATDELVDAIRVVHEGRRYLSREFAGYVALDLADSGSELPHTELSNREYQILQLIVKGQTPRETAAALGISVSTVNTHRQRLLKKMGMRSNAQLVRYAVEHNLVE